MPTDINHPCLNIQRVYRAPVEFRNFRTQAVEASRNMSEALNALYDETYPCKLSYEDEILETLGPCERCSATYTLREVTHNHDRRTIYFRVSCGICGFELAKEIPEAILVRVREQQHNKQGEEMPTVYVLCRGEGRDMHVMDVFTRPSAAANLCMGHPDMKMLPFNVETPDADFFDVYIVTVGKDDRYRIACVTCDKRYAKKIASSVGGIVNVREALPSRRERREIRRYRTFISIDMDCEVIPQGGRYDYMKLFDGQKVPYTVTHRRRYNSDLPHRLEVVGPDSQKVQELCEYLIDGHDDFEEDFEYNVDYVYVEITQGMWEREIKCTTPVEA